MLKGLSKYLALFSAIFFDLHGQPGLCAYASKNASEIASISISDTNYKDLSVIVKAIGDCRVVMLGEMWHGDGATFEAKSRLIRYLHQKLGFNILVFEDDFFSLGKSVEKVDAQELTTDEVIRNNLRFFWSSSEQCQGLFQYLKSNPSLKLCGIDNQLHGKISKVDLKKDVKNYIESTKINYLSSLYYQKHFWKDFDSSFRVVTTYWYKNKFPFSKKVMENLIQAIDSIISQTQEISNNFYRQSLVSYRSLCDMYMHLNDFSKSSSIRDKQMAENLAWLAKERYPNEKIMVWIASTHMIKNNQSAYQKPSKEVSMGYYYSQNKTNPKPYLIGFTSHNGSGNYLSNMKYKIPFSKNKSLERTFFHLQKNYLFVSLKEYEGGDKPEYVYAKIDGAYNIKAQWNNCVDGIFFIRTMTPSQLHKIK